jgi:hypothetical protein
MPVSHCRRVCLVSEEFADVAGSGGAVFDAERRRMRDELGRVWRIENRESYRRRNPLGIAESVFASEKRRVRLSLVLGLIYLFSEILLTITRRGRSKTGEKQDRSTLRMLWIVIMISIGAGVFIAGNWRTGALPHGRMFANAGVVLFAAGLIIRWWAIVTLGRFFTVDVTIEKDHELVERGPFRCVRGIRRIRGCSWGSSGSRSR